jgi:NADP-dependent 3-hydroxy acid dehydrogenase YdfG
MIKEDMKTQISPETLGVDGKSIVVTGGTTGIGRATAILLASHGAKVLVFGREQTLLDDALNAIQATGNKAIGLTADSSNKDDITRIFQTADKELGGVDILINNAALAGQSIIDMPYDEQEYVVRTNLLGYMHMAQEAIKRMRPKSSGHIVFVGSMSANVRETGSSLYVATKSGIQGLTEALRKEVNEMGIKVSLIEPGEVGSDMNPNPPEKQRQRQSELVQMKAEDIADCIYYVLTRPRRMDVIELRVRPHLQLI